MIRRKFGSNARYPGVGGGFLWSAGGGSGRLLRVGGCDARSVREGAGVRRERRARGRVRRLGVVLKALRGEGALWQQIPEIYGFCSYFEWLLFRRNRGGAVIAVIVSDFVTMGGASVGLRRAAIGVPAVRAGRLVERCRGCAGRGSVGAGRL